MTCGACMLSFSPPSAFANSNSKRSTRLINLTRSRKLAGLRASWRITCFQLQVCDGLYGLCVRTRARKHAQKTRARAIVCWFLSVFSRLAAAAASKRLSIKWMQTCSSVSPWNEPRSQGWFLWLPTCDAGGGGDRRPACPGLGCWEGRCTDPPVSHCSARLCTERCVHVCAPV